MNLRVFNVYYPVRNIAFFLIEGFLIFSILLVASIVRDYFFVADPFWFWKVLPKILVVTIVCILSLYYHDLYNFDHIFQERSKKVLFIKSLKTLGVASLALAFIYIIFPGWILSKTVVMLSMLLIISLVLSMRLLYSWALRANKLTEKVLILGANDFASNIIDEIETKPYKGFKTVGILQGPQCFNPPINDIPVLGEVNDVFEVSRKIPCNRIVVSLIDQRGALPLTQLMELKLNGKKINDGVEFYEHLTGKILLERLRPSYFIFSDGFKINKTRQWVKRSLDFFCAMLGTMLFLPLSILIAFVIKLESKGPIIYRQTRVGKGGKLFILYKFRSMYVTAETGKPVWASLNDTRVTRVGRVIRKLSLDEIPQMINVLKGDMSFVGPRPERPFFVEQLSERIPYYVQRHAVAPGMTGWAQIKFRYGASEDDALEKLRYDLYYIKNMSPLLDCTIIFETTKRVLLRKGAR
jgi:sugar transferase (PEP-CTERM system associated)